MHIIDLTLPLTRDMVTTHVVGHHKGFQLEHLANYDKDGKMVSRFTVGTHSGTHTDAPLHFIEGGMPIDKMPLERLVGPAFVARLEAQQPFAVVDRPELEAACCGLEKGDILLVQTGWSARWMQANYYTETPGFTPDAARFMVEKGVRHLGVDMPSIDPCQAYSEKHQLPRAFIHHILLGEGIPITEYLCNLEAIPGDRCTAIVLPLPLAGAEAAPSRAVAVVGREFLKNC